jgi:NADH dehydrogenase [ubiquinone] 1 alpha subcomplex assembly factor 6
MAAPALSYVADQVRRFDHDRFLTTLFVPAQRREAVLSLFAFNLELARARELVREPMMGLMRLQWWRDAIEGIYGGAPRRHEVVAPLAAAIRDHRLERPLLDRLIDAREADMNPAPPADMAALADYAAATSGTLTRLVMAVLAGGDLPPGAGDAAEAIGCAWALTGLVRAVPFHARARRLYLPQSLIDRAGLDVGQLFELRSSPALAEACRVVVKAAGERLADGRMRGRAVPRALRPALLPATLADLYLATLARTGCDPFDPRVQQPAPGRAWRLLLSSLTARV